MNDDSGVAPVVALMLILAVVVTLMSVYASTYLPSLKDESEIHHLDQVKESFIGFSSHIENSAALKTDGTLVSSVPLGGGEITLNQQKSGGMLSVAGEQPVFSVGIIDKYGHPYWANSSIVNFSYQTVNNYWKDQTLSWQLGYINISENERTTPLEFGNMTDVENYIRYNSSFPHSLLDIEYTHGDEFAFDNITSSFEVHHNITGMTITVVDFKPGETNTVSGNGVGKLKLNSRVNTELINSSVVLFDINKEFDINENSDDLPDGFGKSIWLEVGGIFKQIGDFGYYNLDNVQTSSDVDYPNNLGVEFKGPVPVTLKMVNVTVSVS